MMTSTEKANIIRLQKASLVIVILLCIQSICRQLYRTLFQVTHLLLFLYIVIMLPYALFYVDIGAVDVDNIHYNTMYT